MNFDDLKPNGRAMCSSGFSRNFSVREDTKMTQKFRYVRRDTTAAIAYSHCCG